jgi:hypothetical protein
MPENVWRFAWTVILLMFIPALGQPVIVEDIHERRTFRSTENNAYT